LAFRYGSFDPGVACLSYEAWTLWHLGYPDQALKRIQQALTLGRELDQPFTLALVFSFASYLHQYRREWQATQERAEAAIALSTEHGFASWLAVSTILRGRALSEQSQVDEGIAQIHEGLACNRAAGLRTTEAYTLALLAEAQGKAGRIEEGLALLAEALALVDRTEERVYDSELHRLKGQLTLQLGQPTTNPQDSNLRQAMSSGQPETEAAACLRRAIKIARQQSAKSLELRSTTSLARLLRDTGRRAEAHAILAEIYNWFSEGFDTADLKEAKALLDELSR
jgi:predicted ATPase